MFSLKTTTTGAALMIGAAALTGCGPVATTATEAPAPWAEMPACTEEDGTYHGRQGCFWDATSRGNGEGTSFYTLEDGTTVTLPPAVVPPAR